MDSACATGYVRAGLERVALYTLLAVRETGEMGGRREMETNEAGDEGGKSVGAKRLRSGTGLQGEARHGQTHEMFSERGCGLLATTRAAAGWMAGQNKECTGGVVRFPCVLCDWNRDSFPSLRTPTIPNQEQTSGRLCAV